MSKCGKNEKVAHEVQSNESLMFLPHYSTATWYLFVLYDRGAKLSVLMLSMRLSSKKS